MGPPTSLGREEEDLEEVDGHHDDVEAEKEGRRSPETLRLNEKSGQGRADEVAQRER